MQFPAMSNLHWMHFSMVLHRAALLLKWPKFILSYNNSLAKRNFKVNLVVILEVLITHFTNRGKSSIMLHLGAGH